MTDEQAALAWLDRAYTVEDQGRFYLEFSEPHRATLKRMLAQPRLPTFEEFSRAFDAWLLDARETISYGGGGNPRALYAHLTKPRTKTVEVWYVHYAGFVLRTSGRRWERLVTVHGTEDEANRAAFDYEAEPSHYRHVRVTGPHAQEVPV